MQHQSHTQRSLSQEILLILASQVDEPKTATTLHEAVIQTTGLVISGMVVACIAIGVWLVDLWVVFPLFDFGLLIQLLLGFVLMVVATATALVALVRSTITLRAISAAPNNTSSLPQRDRTDSKVWIMVLSLGLFAFIGTIMLIFVHVGPIMFLLLSLFAGLVSMMNALAMKKNRMEIADLSNQEPL